NLTVLVLPIGDPFFTGCRVTVTSSPALNEVRAQPHWTMVDGACVSTAQWATLPLSFLTSNFRKQCGLDQTHSVTVPFNVMVFSSKLAVPWCANSGAECARRMTAATRSPANVVLINPSVFSITGYVC